MFDIGFFELLVIGVVALVVLGPERLPKAARYAGLWVRKARAQWYSVKAEFEREVAADDMRRSIGDPARDLRDQVDGLGQELRQTASEVQQSTRLPDDPPAAQAAPATDPAPGAEPPAAEASPAPADVPPDPRP